MNHGSSQGVHQLVGPTGKSLAETLRDWIPQVINAAKPCVSSRDIGIGQRWNPALAQQLESTTIGIICVTSRGPGSAWQLFEAGALSKTLGNDTLVCPYLLGVGAVDLEGPLSQFQATLANEEDTKHLMQTINATLGNEALDEAHLEKAYQKWWPDLKRALTSMPNEQGEASAPLESREILEEILQLTRGLDGDMCRIMEGVSTLEGGLTGRIPTIEPSSGTEPINDVPRWRGELARRLLEVKARRSQE